jgi:hypothetical protein
MPPRVPSVLLPTTPPICPLLRLETPRGDARPRLSLSRVNGGTEAELVHPQRRGCNRHLSPPLLSVHFSFISLEILVLTPPLNCVWAACGGRRHWSSARADVARVSVQVDAQEQARASRAPRGAASGLLSISGVSSAASQTSLGEPRPSPVDLRRVQQATHHACLEHKF